MNDFYIDLAVSVILRVVQSGPQRNKYRKALLKIFKAIAQAYKSDAEFDAVMVEQFKGR